MPAGGARGIKIALVSYVAVFAILMTAFLLTETLILFSQSLEVLGDVFVSAFLLMSIRLSARPADRAHMFGHGRAQFVAALVTATILILFMGVEVFREAVPRLVGPAESVDSSGSGLGIIVILASMAILAVPLSEFLRDKKRDASSKAQFVQLVKDEASYLPALAGIMLVVGGYGAADAATSVLIGIIIVASGLYLLKDNADYLLGRSPGPDYLKKVEGLAMSVAGVVGVHDLIAELVGPRKVHAGMHVEVASGTTIEEADRISHAVEEAVRRETGCEQCVIHVDPAGAT